MKLSEQVRNESYLTISPEIGARQREVLEALRSFPHGATGIEIAKKLGRECYTILPRLTELYRKNLIEEFGTAFREDTKKKVTIWKALDEFKFDGEQRVWA